jgi:hypothetical protein
LSIDIASLSDPLTYTFTKEDINNSFASDNGQEEDHTLEESICRQSIGQQIH